MGRPALFVRFTGCNLSCELCDTKYSWKPGELECTDHDPEAVREMIFDSNRIVFTGGEPLLSANMKRMMELTDNFSFAKDYEIETNGTILPSDGILDRLNDRRVRLNISPKFNVYQERAVDTTPVLVDRIMNSEFECLKRNLIVKILFETPLDIDEAQKFAHEHNVDPSQLWLQPCGTSSYQLKIVIKRCEDVLLSNNINLSLRSHVFLYEDLKGK